MYSRILSDTGHCVMFNGVGGGLVSVYMKKQSFRVDPREGEQVWEVNKGHGELGPGWAKL